MFIQDFYLGLDGKQRIIVLSAAGAVWPSSALLRAMDFLRRPDSDQPF